MDLGNTEYGVFFVSFSQHAETGVLQYTCFLLILLYILFIVCYNYKQLENKQFSN